MKLSDALRAATARLAVRGVPGPARDARLLLAATLRVPPERLTLVLDLPIDEATASAFDAMVAERARRRPVSQILGRRSFWGRDFEVSADVLDPRPETETLVEAALAGPAPATVLDLGTGSGAILITLLAEWPDATGLGIDASPEALLVAGRNAARHGLSARVRLETGDWLENLAGRYDLVVCNPPYVRDGDLDGLDPEVRRWEPRGALTAGPTGLESYRSIAPALGCHLSPEGRALFEIGPDQAAAVCGIFAAAGFPPPAIHRDLDGRDRVIELAAPAEARMRELPLSFPQREL